MHALGRHQADLLSSSPKIPFVDIVQVVEVRARLQRALGRPFPLEEVTTLTLAKLRALEAKSGLTGRPAAANPKPNPADNRAMPGAGKASTSVPAANPAGQGSSGGSDAAGAAAAAAAAGSIGNGIADAPKAKAQQVSKL